MNPRMSSTGEGLELGVWLRVLNDQEDQVSGSTFPTIFYHVTVHLRASLDLASSVCLRSLSFRHAAIRQAVLAWLRCRSSHVPPGARPLRAWLLSGMAFGGIAFFFVGHPLAQLVDRL